MATLGQMPAEIRQGETVVWTVSADATDYPANTHTLTCTLWGPGQQRTTITGVASGSTHWTLTLSSTNCAALRPGPHLWQYAATDGTTKFYLGTGTVNILPDLADEQTPPLDHRTMERKQADALDAMLTDPAVLRQLDPASLDSLFEQSRKLRYIVAGQEDKAKLAAAGYPTRKIFTRFA